MPDSEIMTKAREEERVLLTMDLDFPALLAASGGRFPSVVVFRLSNERPENVNEKLADVLERFGDVLTDGAIVSVRESLVRLRKLPLNA